MPMNDLPSGFEEDDRLRSDYIRMVTLRQIQSGSQTDLDNADEPCEIPRTLVRFWHDPLDVPEDVLECLNTWETLRDEGFTFHMFDDASAAAFISERYGRREVEAFALCRHPAMRSDYLRMCFIVAEGGLYVDADDVLVGSGWRRLFRDPRLKVQALCYDVRAGAMVAASEIRRADLPTAGRIFYVNNNPIAAPAGHPVLRRALARATSLLLEGKPSPEIQSTTGPGNMTAALAAHAHESLAATTPPDFELLLDWEDTAEPRWDLAYRLDERNWRKMDGR